MCGVTDTVQPREIQIEDLWSAVQRGEADGATMVIDDAVRIEDYRPSLAKGLASIWGLGHLVSPHVVISEDMALPSEEDLVAEAWDRVGQTLWSVFPPLDDLEGSNRQ